MRELRDLSLRLLLFTLAAGLLLALTNAITEGPIAEQKIKQANASRYALFPAADGFEPVEGIDAENTTVCAAMGNGEILGYTFERVVNGYKGPISMTIGVTKHGSLADVIINSQEETQGVGSRITGSDFLKQFKGLPAGADAITAGVDTITGATVSSRTVRSAVSEAAGISENTLHIMPNAAMPLREDDLFRLETMPGAEGFDEIDLISLLGDYGAITSVKTAYSGPDIAGYSFDLEGGSTAITLGVSASGTILGLTVNGEARPEYTGLTLTAEALEAVAGAEEEVTLSLCQAGNFFEQFLRGMTGQKEAVQ